MKLNKPYTDKEYADFAVYCNENGLIVEDKGDCLESVKPVYPDPTYEEQRQRRAAAYASEVDSLTAHIQRERDEAEPDKDEIAALISERVQKVAEIKERYPYPHDDETE